MFSHVTLGANDIPRAIAFYDRALATLGLARQETDLELGWAGWAPAADASRPFWVMRPLDGKPATVGNGVTIAFEAPDRPTVDAFHEAALAAGGTDEGGPGLRPHYHADFYAAYVRDPDGNKLCCVCHCPVG
jgi:catechol 2,3-dioxygenase-like lactoylglutathione lyase family enzyme